MPTLDYDPALHFNLAEADKSLQVKFYSKPVQDPAASLKEGRPIFVDKDYIQIATPGNKLGDIVRIATAQDKERFAGYWHSYQNRTNNDEILQGTPLTEWPLMTRSQVENLAFFNVKTVEQLAAMSDVNSHVMMNFHSMKQKAQQWLDSAKAQAPMQQLQEELRKRDLEIAAQKHAIEQLGAQVQAMQNGQPVPVAAPAAAPTVTLEQMAALIENAVSKRLESVAAVTPAPARNKGGRPRKVPVAVE